MVRASTRKSAQRAHERINKSLELLTRKRKAPSPSKQSNTATRGNGKGKSKSPTQPARILAKKHRKRKERKARLRKTPWRGLRLLPMDIKPTLLAVSLNEWCEEESDKRPEIWNANNVACNCHRDVPLQDVDAGTMRHLITRCKSLKAVAPSLIECMYIEPKNVVSVGDILAVRGEQDLEGLINLCAAMGCTLHGLCIASRSAAVLHNWTFESMEFLRWLTLIVESQHSHKRPLIESMDESENDDEIDACSSSSSSDTENEESDEESDDDSESEGEDDQGEEESESEEEEEESSESEEETPLPPKRKITGTAAVYRSLASQAKQAEHVTGNKRSPPASASSSAPSPKPAEKEKSAAAAKPQSKTTANRLNPYPDVPAVEPRGNNYLQWTYAMQEEFLRWYDHFEGQVSRTRKIHAEMQKTYSWLTLMHVNAHAQKHADKIKKLRLPKKAESTSQTPLAHSLEADRTSDQESASERGDNELDGEILSLEDRAQLLTAIDGSTNNNSAIPAASVDRPMSSKRPTVPADDSDDELLVPINCI